MAPRAEKFAKGTAPGKRCKTARPSAIILGEPDDYGPAMQKLTDNRKKFVIAYVHYAGGCATPEGWHTNITDAAWLAGIGGTRDMARIEGGKLMRNPFVLAALREEDDRAAQGDLTMNRRTAVQIRDNGGEKAADRLKAAQWLDQLAGRAPRTEHLVTHEHVLGARTTAELQKELRDFYSANPDLVKLEPPKELPVDIVEAEFIEIQTDESKISETIPVVGTFEDAA